MTSPVFKAGSPLLDSPDVVFVHGMWCHPDVARPLERALASKGFIYHKPELPHHGREQDLEKLGSLSVRDYVESIKKYISDNNLDRPLLIGHSMGGLIAQIVAAEIEVSGIVLINSAAGYGVNHIFPSSLWATRHICIRGAFWKKANIPPYRIARFGMLNRMSEFKARQVYKDLRWESGRCYAEFVFWWLDSNKAIKIPGEVSGKKLIITSQKDRIVVPHVARALQRQYPEANVISLPENGHWVFGEDGDEAVYERVIQWIRRHASIDVSGKTS